MRNKQIRKIVLAGVLTSMTVLLKTYFSLQLGVDMRVSIFPIPLLIAGYFLGPIYGLACGFAADTAYFMLSPMASFWSIFTISTMIWGLAGGLLKIAPYRSSIFTFIIIITFTSILETSINTIGLHILKLDIYRQLVTRVITMFVRVPVLVYLTKSLVSTVTKLETAAYNT